MILPAGKAEEVEAGISLTAVRVAGDSHLSTVDSPRCAEENDNVAIEHVAACVEGERRVGTEVNSVRADRRRQRQVYAGPSASAIGRGVTSHGQPENLVRAAGDRRWIHGVQRDVRFTLRPTFVRNVHVASYSCRTRVDGQLIGAVLQQQLIFHPPPRLESLFLN